MKKYLYLIKKAKIKSWLKFWLLTKDQVKYILSEILEGFSFNLQNTVKRYFKIFNIFGNSVQDGTPTPTNPVPIESVADDVNMALITSTSSTNYNSILKNGEITINGTSTSATNVVVYLNNQTDLKLKENQSYIISIIFTGEISGDTYKAVYLNFVDTNVLAGSISSNSKITYTYTPNVETIFKMVNFDLGANNTFNNMKVQIKVQKGTEATPYSPYNQGTVTIKQRGTTESNNYTFQTEPLRSLPNGVRDSLEADGIHRKIVIQTGTLSQTTAITLSDAKQNGAYMCNIKSAGTLTGKTIELEAGDYEIIYELAEEIIEPYTEEQQAEYNKIKELYTFDGTTNISSTDVVPPYLQIQYYMKGE